MENVFRMPTLVKITGRTSSVTNSFVNGIIPIIMPTKEEITEVLGILGMNEQTIRCVYCGDRHTEWDHFRPIVQKKKPTGYISEIHNLVPTCGKCNQSKGNYYWKDWILGDARLSPKARNVEGLSIYIANLEKYEAWSCPTVMDFEEIVGKDMWRKHWDNCEKIHEMMRESQKLSDEIKIKILAKEIQKVNSISLAVVSQLGEGNFNSRKIGIIVQTSLKEALEKNTITSAELIMLQTLEYSNSTFSISYPLLKKLVNSENMSGQMKDHLGRNRYYRTPITVNGNNYLLCSQWYETNKPDLIKWLNLHGYYANKTND